MYVSPCCSLSALIRYLSFLYSDTHRRSDDEASDEDSEGSSLSESEEQSQNGSGSESDSGTDYPLFKICIFISLCLLRRFLTHICTHRTCFKRDLCRNQSMTNKLLKLPI